MTIAALGELRSRKLAVARKEAVQCLEALRNAAQSIRQAKGCAECDITLDLSLVKRANLLLKRFANGEVQNMDYLTTLEFYEQASTARDQIIRTARQTLEAELGAREAAKSARIDQLSKEKNACIYQLSNEFEAELKAREIAKVDRIERAVRPQMPAVPKDVAGCAGFLGIILACCGGPVVGQVVEVGEGNSLLVFIFIFGLGFIIYPGIVYGTWGLDCNAAKRKAEEFDDWLERTLARAEAQKQEAIADAEARKQDIIAAAEARKQKVSARSETQKKKVVDALSLIAALGPVRAAGTPAAGQTRDAGIEERMRESREQYERNRRPKRGRDQF